VRSIYTSCVSAILVACTGPATNKTEPAPISGSAEPAASATTCVVRGTDPDPAHGNYPPKADSITMAGDEVKLCWNARPARTCWRLDVAKKVFEWWASVIGCGRVDRVVFEMDRRGSTRHSGT
jgi:hypothetical protein